jgi:hypothetical protein
VPATAWALIVLRRAVREGAPCPRVRVITVQAMCWTVIGVNAVDGIGLAVAGDRVATTSTYDVLRLIPGGMRTYGVLLLLGALSLTLALVFANPSRLSARVLQAALSFGVGYNLMWVLCIPAAWWHAHTLPSAWPAVSKYALLATLYFFAARAVAPPPRRRR